MVSMLGIATPWWLVLLIGLVLWSIVIVLFFDIRKRVDDFFAMRRHNRRMRRIEEQSWNALRDYAEKDAQFTLRLYDAMGRPTERMVKNERHNSR